jgi:hypothetical protein
METTSTELDDFYEALVDPSKTENYITRLTSEIQQNNNELDNINTLFQLKILKINEYTEEKQSQENADHLLDEIV